MLGRSLQHKLGTALCPPGRSRCHSRVRDGEALAPDGIDEPTAKAHYSLGVLLASNGRGAEAVTHLSAAVKFNPNYLEARQALGDALSRAGRPEPALGPNTPRSFA